MVENGKGNINWDRGMVKNIPLIVLYAFKKKGVMGKWFMK